jgi:hypothetical protein
VPTGFLPSVHGFRFPNWFPPGTPVLRVPTPFGRVPVGTANGGLCGGMVFTALDHFAHGLPIPAVDDPPPELVAALGRRLVDSFDLPFGVLRYYDWQRRPLADRSLGRAGLTALTLREWAKLQPLLDAGQPTPLGLVNAEGLSPRWLGENHQVLATGYDLHPDTGELTVHVYDPNHPRADDVRLRWNVTADPAVGQAVTHSHEGRPVRGFFVSEYRRPG